MNFNPRTPSQNATHCVYSISPFENISIHALPHRMRLAGRYALAAAGIFQSTHSLTECDGMAWQLLAVLRHISIHALPHRMRRWLEKYQNIILKISIHALPHRMRRTSTSPKGGWLGISIHALPHRMRLNVLGTKYTIIEFQSTHSLTECDFGKARFCVSPCISIHALPHRMRQRNKYLIQLFMVISIHALPHRMRPFFHKIFNSSSVFQSTHSLTECDFQVILKWRVRPKFQSTHSLTECDTSSWNLL